MKSILEYLTQYNVDEKLVLNSQSKLTELSNEEKINKIVQNIIANELATH